MIFSSLLGEVIQKTVSEPNLAGTVVQDLIHEVEYPYCVPRVCLNVSLCWAPYLLFHSNLCEFVDHNHRISTSHV